ncbi:3'-5' exonuclease [Luteibacter sp. dw_328]|uniref:3'-5' exonuclease n=1 Tax=Luteibacter sp. dw_328 TaxID=2719796 RepID=UPI001BD1C813|nr:3'-5' exonuclease [Luteibacter sp. dw_328]
MASSPTVPGAGVPVLITSERPAKRPRVWRERPSKQELAQLPRFSALGPDQVIVVQSPSSAAKAAAALTGATTLGFDTESRPVFQPGVKSTGPHLVQLATDRTAVLFPLTGLEMDPLLRQILEDGRVIKVGFGLGGDKTKLFNKFGLRMRGTAEVSGLVQALGFRQRVGLQTAVAVVLGQYLVKSKKITTSNWGARPLSAAQVMYAAHDAVASLRVYRAVSPVPVDPTEAREA